MQGIGKWLMALAALTACVASAARPVAEHTLDKAVKAQFTKLPAKSKARQPLSLQERQQLEDWLARAEDKGIVSIDHNDPRDLEGQDLQRRLHGYAPRSTHLRALARRHPQTGRSGDPACQAFLAEYRANALFLDVGQKDGMLMATVLQANARGGLQPVTYANLLTVNDSDGNPATSGDGIGHSAAILVTNAPPRAGVYRKEKPPRASAEYTVFMPNGTPCDYREVKTMRPWPQSMAVTAPNNTRGNSKTVLCLNRANPDPNWPQPCDFGPFPQAKHATGWAVVVPQEGEIVLPGPVATKADGSVDADLRVTAINMKDGQTCQGQDVDVGKAVLAAAKVDPQNASKVRWTLTKDNAPVFGQTCYDSNTGLAFNMFWNIRVNSGAAPLTVTASVSNTLTQGSYNTLIVPAVDLQFGCLPAGTQVTMANGERKAIETIATGDLVLGADGKPWEVWSRMAGEELSLVRITAADGSVVSASEAHPIVVGTERDGRPRAVSAAEVKVGMHLTTSRGASTVASAAKAAYDGRVYNLAIRPQGAGRPAAEGGSFYADGVLVGDQTLQGKISSLASQADTKGKVRP
ncbi:Hint domain-containing protein [Massilia sp. YIM B04103]|uniref:Hint domain-containing protein n=1 Tax=Massilia sp. YIM B04103 TaxID=2963106 RepID=UPI002108E336|nr:Hint domain-containing protein [Massilia sp. YIM B04103]